MENSNNTGKLIGALLIGVAVGATVGILLAPDKGSETRKKIAGKADDLGDDLQEKFKMLADEVKKEVAVAKEKASEMLLNGHTK